MNLLRILLGRKSKKRFSQFSKTKFEQHKPSLPTTIKVPTEILHQISTIKEDEIIRKIRIKRQKNMQLFENNYNTRLKLIDSGKSEEAYQIDSFDPGYFEFYQDAQEEEEKGNLKRAAEIYWYNIFNNGTDAPANFSRLLILLRKLKEFEKELVVARVYRNFSDGKKLETIDKRIETIKQKMNT